MTDTIHLDPNNVPTLIPCEPAEEDPQYIKHVHCEGARFHNLHWDSNGTHCSDSRCIVNKPYNKIVSGSETR